MLTLVETKDAIPLLGIYATGGKAETSQSARKKRTGTVYFTHDLDPDKQNVSCLLYTSPSPRDRG